MGEFFFKGLAAGLVVAMPFGPVGIVCIQRTIASGPLTGLASGAGAALADGLFAALAAFGVKFVSSFLTGHTHLLRGVGGVCLLAMGLFMLKRPESRAAAQGAPGAGHYLRAAGSTLALAAANPLVVLVLAAMFAGLGLGHRSHDYGHALEATLGVAAGSGLWWTAIALGGHFNRDRLASVVEHTRVAAAVGVAAFGAAALVFALA